MNTKQVNAKPEHFAGSINTPFGAQFINRGDAADHAQMRSKQLTSLLRLLSGEGASHFRALDESAQDSLLWLARQLAAETEAMFDMVASEAQGGLDE